MTASLAAAARRNKSTTAATPAKPGGTDQPNNPSPAPGAHTAPTRLMLWRVLASSRFSTDAREIVKRGKELLELVEQFLEEHDEDGYVRALREAGVGEFADAHHGQTGTNIIADMRGLAWALDMGVEIIKGETYPTVPTAEELEEEALARAAR